LQDRDTSVGATPEIEELLVRVAAFFGLVHVNVDSRELDFD
jgi:hypothetical protein